MLRGSYKKFSLLHARELRKYTKAIRNCINRAHLASNPASESVFSNDLTPYLYVHRIYQYLNCLEHIKFRNTLHLKHAKRICYKLKRWNITHSLNLEFLIRLYVAISKIEGYFYLPLLHCSISQRVGDAESLIKLLRLENLQGEFAFNFIIEYSRFDIFMGNYSRVQGLIDAFRDLLNVKTQPNGQSSLADLVGDAIKMYQTVQNIPNSIVYDDLSIYIELALTLSWHIAAKGDVIRSNKTISQLFHTLWSINQYDQAGQPSNHPLMIYTKERLEWEMANCSLYALSILVGNVENDYNAILPALELFSQLKLDSLNSVVYSHIIRTIINFVSKIGRDYQLIHSQSGNKDLFNKMFSLLEIFVHRNPNLQAIKREMLKILEFNLEIPKALKFIQNSNVAVPNGMITRLKKKAETLSQYGSVDNIPRGTFFPLVQLSPREEILPFTHEKLASCIKEKGLARENLALALERYVWVTARKVDKDGFAGHGLLLNVGEDKIYGIWNRVGKCISGFFPSENYAVMDKFNGHLDSITLANTGADVTWRLHPIVNLSNPGVLEAFVSCSTPNDLAVRVYNIAKAKIDGLFERAVLVPMVTMDFGKLACNRPELSEFIKIQPGLAITRKWISNLVTIKLDNSV